MQTEVQHSKQDLMHLVMALVRCGLSHQTFAAFTPAGSDQMAGNMKLQLAAAVCLILLVVSEMPGASEAAGCDIFQMMPCVAASKNGAVKPSTQCCTNVGNMGRGISGARCLCSLVSQPLAKSQGVVPRIALAIPQKCGIPVPRGFVCQGIRVPGS